MILAIVVLVFGAAKLPDLARGTGQALRIFKTETKGLRDDDDDVDDAEARPSSARSRPARRRPAQPRDRRATWSASGATTPPPDPG